MRIVVIGGTGLIGSRLVALLSAAGHEPVAASRGRGQDAVSGAGLAEAMSGAVVVIDVSNAPSADGEVARAFFDRSTRNLLAAGTAAGVGHHVVLSIVGTDRMTGSPYYGAKLLQERITRAAPLPHSIVRATQFFEFLGDIADFSTVDGAVRVAPVALQPVAAADVAAALARVATGPPLGGDVEVAGPDRLRFPGAIRDVLAARGDPRPVVADGSARYSGATLTEDSLVPVAGASLGPTRLRDWLADPSGPG